MHSNKRILEHVQDFFSFWLFTFTRFVNISVTACLECFNIVFGVRVVNQKLPRLKHVSLLPHNEIILPSFFWWLNFEQLHNLEDLVHQQKTDRQWGKQTDTQTQTHTHTQTHTDTHTHTHIHTEGSQLIHFSLSLVQSLLPNSFEHCSFSKLRLLAKIVCDG